MLQDQVDSAILAAQWHNQAVTAEALKFGCTIQNIAQGSLAEALGLDIGDLLLLRNGSRLSSRWQLSNWPEGGEIEYQFYRPSNRESLVATTALMPLGAELGYSGDLALLVAKEGQFMYRDIISLWCAKEWDDLEKIAAVLFPQAFTGLLSDLANSIFKRSLPVWDPELSNFIRGCVDFEFGRLKEAKQAFAEHYEDSFYSYPSDFAALYYYYQAKIAQQEWKVTDAENYIIEAFLQVDSVVYGKSPITNAIVQLYKEIHQSDPISELKRRIGQVLSWNEPLIALNREKLLEKTHTIDEFVQNLEVGQKLIVCCMGSKRTAPIYSDFLQEFEVYWRSFNHVIPHLVVITNTLQTTAKDELDLEAGLIDRHPDSMTVLYDESNSLLESWEVSSYPYIIMIDKNAQVIYEGLPFDDFQWMSMLKSH